MWPCPGAVSLNLATTRGHRDQPGSDRAVLDRVSAAEGEMLSSLPPAQGGGPRPREFRLGQGPSQESPPFPDCFHQHQ